MSQALLADRNEKTQTNETYLKLRKELEEKKKSMKQSYKSQSQIDDAESIRDEKMIEALG